MGGRARFRTGQGSRIQSPTGNHNDGSVRNEFYSGEARRLIGRRHQPLNGGDVSYLIDEINQWIDSHQQPMTDAALDQLWVAEMERRDRESEAA